ncbi:MAG: Type secretion system protein GspE, partial [Deltaproteobacteria bacterium]|nr:Type secretion system protein GspE [Deltaproteobacteria bacterium]
MAKKLGELLVDAGLISAEQLAKALANQKVNKKRIGEIIVDLKMASEMDIVQTLYFELGVDSLDLSKAIIDPMAIQLVPEKLARKFSLLPISVDGKVLTVAMLDPLDFEALDDIRFATGYKLKPVATTRTELLHAIDIHYSASDSIAEILVKDLSKEKSEVEVVVEKEGSDAATLRKESETPPVIRMVNLMISDAVKSRASDLHMEPQERRLLIRNRVDGLLNNVMELPKWIQGSIVSRVKIMARMDIAEKRTPQDGRVKLRVDGKEIDLRISVLPTQYGEKVVMRLLDTKAAALPLSKLGFTAEELKKISVLISKTQGVILITGPTGSGKSSTLYGIITQLKSEHVNIITLEDPIEFEIEGVSQVMIDERVGLTFANGLRSILRQDPNVVMVGEM